MGHGEDADAIVNDDTECNSDIEGLFIPEHRNFDRHISFPHDLF